MSKKMDQDTRDIILTNLGSSLTIFLFGFVVAYLLYRNSVEYRGLIFWFTVLIFLIIAIISFFRKCKKQRELYNKRKLNRENIDIVDNQNNEE